MFSIEIKHKMNKKIEKIFLMLEQQRQNLLNEIQFSSDVLLASKPDSSKWSVLEILTHLYSSEKLSFSYIKKKSLGINELDNAGIKQALLMPVVKISQRLPFRFKAPKVVIENTSDTLPLAQLISSWGLLRLELKAHLENLADSNIHKLVYKHPIAGRLSLPQAMQFFAEHINHHKPQIKRALKVNLKN
jgi:uncharacterized damage-inducible protein DinB